MKLALLLFVFAVLAVFPARAVPQDDTAGAGERFRIRVQNAPLGRVEVSADGGATYFLVARVTRPAGAVVPDRDGTAPGRVARSSRDGLAFSVGAGLALKLLPAPTARKGANGRPAPRPNEPSSALTNQGPNSPLWSAFVPVSGGVAGLQHRPGELSPFPKGYAPGDEDVFVFVSTEWPTGFAPGGDAAASQAKLEGAAREAGERYAKEALARAKAEGRRVVSGVLELEAKLPEGEPDPIAFVTFALDGATVSTRNTPPFRYAWDTREAGDGERAVEVRALNAQGRLLTLTRALVVVHTPPRPPKPGAP